jgi:hypothetical protein
VPTAASGSAWWQCACCNEASISAAYCMLH